MTFASVARSTGSTFSAACAWNAAARTRSPVATAAKPLRERVGTPWSWAIWRPGWGVRAVSVGAMGH